MTWGGNYIGSGGVSKRRNDKMYIMNEGIHRLEEMARIGRAGRYDICVYSGEGPVPHFHFKNLQTGKEGCMRLDCAAYFPHNRYTATLNTKERQALVKFLMSPSTFRSTSQFQKICLLWNDNNPQYQMHGDPYSFSIPRYEDM